jgi:hypothetical protein
MDCSPLTTTLKVLLETYRFLSYITLPMTSPYLRFKSRFL